MGLNEDALYYIDKGDIESLKDCLDQGVDLTNICKGRYLIDTAYSKKKLGMVKFLIPYSTEEDISDAFAHACKSEDFTMMDFLLSNGADIHYASDRPFYNSVYQNSCRSVQYLIGKGVPVDVGNNFAIISASNLGLYNMVKLLIENNADVNTRSGSPLICACRRGDLDIVDLLVKNGALIDMKHLEVALRNNNQDVVLYLIKDIDYISKSKMIYKQSIEKGMLKVIQFLEKSVPIPTDIEDSILIASFNGYLNVIKHLASKGIPIPKQAREETKYQKVIEFIDRIYFKENEPKNNDGRDKCYWCGGETKTVNTGFSFINVCGFCGK